MVAHPPSAALENKAHTAPNQQWLAIAMRSDNPVKRAVDVMCIVLIQLLILMVLIDEKDPEKRRSCYVLAPDSILARLAQGEDFGLPLALAASIRLAVRLIRAEYNLGQDYIDRLTAPTPPSLPRRQPHRRSPPAGVRPVPRIGRRPTVVCPPSPISLGHHPPPRPPPLQNPQNPIPPSHAQNVPIP